MHLYIIPAYDSQLKGGIFSPSFYQDPLMALPFQKLREKQNKNGFDCETIDAYDGKKKDFYVINLGNIKYDCDSILEKSKKNIYIQFEPKLIKPKFYEHQDTYLRNYNCLYSYSSDDLTEKSLKKYTGNIYFPIGIPQNISKITFKEKINKAVMIVGKHLNFLDIKGELYSQRNEIIYNKNFNNQIDLFGRGWVRLFDRRNRALEYFMNFNNIRAKYRGKCSEKMETLRQYRFCICFENYVSKSYITEKIYDCFTAGTVPIYLGAPNISEFVPSECFIDMRNFCNVQAALDYASNLNEIEFRKYTENIENFILNFLHRNENFLSDIL
ncbi:glycosyltransferase family 10 [Alphaproteobacteria bacterium]|nr:glycosyltransferase family 10 [Alphaproteobacteria bacterium]